MLKRVQGTITTEQVSTAKSVQPAFVNAFTTHFMVISFHDAYMYSSV